MAAAEMYLKCALFQSLLSAPQIKAKPKSLLPKTATGRLILSRDNLKISLSKISEESRTTASGTLREPVSTRCLNYVI